MAVSPTPAAKALRRLRDLIEGLALDEQERERAKRDMDTVHTALLRYEVGPFIADQHREPRRRDIVAMLRDALHEACDLGRLTRNRWRVRGYHRGAEVLPHRSAARFWIIVQGVRFEVRVRKPRERKPGP